MRLKKFLDFTPKTLYSEPRGGYMLKKMFGKIKKATSGDTAPKPKSSPQARLLTAEGWKRLMMKKYRKSS